MDWEGLSFRIKDSKAPQIHCQALHCDHIQERAGIKDCAQGRKREQEERGGRSTEFLDNDDRDKSWLPRWMLLI